MTCFAPLAGIASGFVLSWLLFFAVPPLPSPLVTHRDIATRLFLVQFAILGWAVGVVLGQARKLHCGGTQELDESSRQRYAPLAIVFLLFCFLSIVMLTKGWWILYYLTAGLSMVALACEIGWEDPLIMLRGWLTL